ncbi:MAG TPA: hypothetical protein DEQ38_05695 [Elusimicrobia bacterium]|nr:MAG: hypothetical protein A2089_13400 [Elusimicrobia bacterium GWD2_63_28]HCC47594.1 hypothetical protein [Elusimicrobiota bacterium]
MKKPAALLIKSRARGSKVPNAVPPLGILYLAASLRARLGAEVRLIDAYFESDAPGAAARAVRELKPDVVGISCLTAESPLAYKIAAAVKAESPGTAVVLGGPHPSSDPGDALTTPAVDAAVLGEGEETFTELVSLIKAAGPEWKKPENLRRVPGLAFRGEGGVEFSAPRPPIQDLDSLPFPAWDLLDYRRYWQVNGMSTMGNRAYLPMTTSRGCPYHCVFCHRIFGKAFRARSPESVAEEAALIKKLGAGHVEFYDDIANLDAARFTRILELLAARGPDLALSFPNGLRADLLDEPQIELLQRAGAREVSVAVETASPRLQKMLDKNLSLEKTTRAINLLADRRIFTRGFFMLGLPTETAGEMMETIRYAHRSRLHMAFFFTPNPYPNTELYEMFAKAGRLPAGASAADYEYHAAPFNASEMSGLEYRLLYKWAFLGFFLNPLRMYRAARDGGFGWDMPLRGWQLLRNSISFSPRR